MPSLFYGLFKTYSELNFEEINVICEDLNARKSIQKFDLEAILCTYKGQSIFSMQEQVNLYATIEKVLMEKEF